MNTQVLLDQAKSAREAGFEKVASELEVKADRARKLAIAFEHYKHVTQDDINTFNAKLKANTSKTMTIDEAVAKGARKISPYDDYLSIRGRAGTCVVHDKLLLEPLEGYAGLPPADVLAKVKEARGRKCFDTWEVASVQPVATEIKLEDPIVFGRIDGCDHRFVIAVWGSDVSVDDLVGPNGG